MKTKGRFSAITLIAMLAVPVLTGAKDNGCGGDVPIGGDDPGGASSSSGGSGEACGEATCGAGEFCCNESCSICAPEGGACTLQFCGPAEIPCGPATCGAEEFCCDPACGICGKDGLCPAIACEEPVGEPCGKNFCGAGEFCCNSSCGTCSADGTGCDKKLCLPDQPCFPTGCSSQLCADHDILTDCSWTEDYGCYQQLGVCEPDAQGQCGWVQTPELQACLDAH